MSIFLSTFQAERRMKLQKLYGNKIGSYEGDFFPSGKLSINFLLLATTEAYGYPYMPREG